jgi:hypothetical protein
VQIVVLLWSFVSASPACFSSDHPPTTDADEKSLLTKQPRATLTWLQGGMPKRFDATRRPLPFRILMLLASFQPFWI